MVAALDRGDFWFNPMKLELYMKHRESPPAKLSIEETPILELTALPPHLWYVFLGRDDIFPVIIAADLDERQVDGLVVILKWFK